MLRNGHLSRRTMLHGIGAAVSLPMLEVMTGKTARAKPEQKTPARLAYLYLPNGVAAGAWQPKRVDKNSSLLELNRWMSPLVASRDDLMIFKNMWTPRGNGQIAGTATWLTGGSFNEQHGTAGGTSADQIAAQRFKNKTLLASLELSCKGEGIFASSLP